MQLSETIKIYPTKYQKGLILTEMDEYISTVNSLVYDAVCGKSIKKLTSAGVDAALPSAIRNQCIRDANSIVNKHYKACQEIVKANRNRKLKVLAPHLPILRKPCCYVNNQNFKTKEDRIEFPVMINGKSKRISVKTKMTENQKAKLSSHKLGTMRIVIKNNALVIQMVYDIEELKPFENGNVMGVDLGIKCPAVSYCTDGSIKFYGNGRKNKYMRRSFKIQRERLQKAKKYDALKHINNKEQRIMKDIDHKLSRQIVSEAVVHGVSVIRLEQLSSIRSTTRTSRKNNYSLHTWSFYRLAKYIEYKAKLVGITVEYVNPAYTSQRCPVCGEIHHADDRNYVCSCGYHTHRDIVGAINICNSTESVGNRQAA